MSNDKTFGNPEANQASRETSSESFLQRWSERKIRSRESVPVREPEHELPDRCPPVAPSASRELTDADMPPLESLDEHSDYSGFLSPKVSSELRRLALRKLFHGAAFNITDGLDDYDEDFTSFAKLGNIVTHDMRRMLELEAKRSAQQETQKAGAQHEFAHSPVDSANAQLPNTPSDRKIESEPPLLSEDEEDLEA